MEYSIKLGDIVGPNLEDEVFDLISSNTAYSVFEDYDSFKVLVIRQMILAEDELRFSSSAFLLTSDSIYSFNHAQKLLRKLESGVSELLENLEKIYRSNQRILSGYSIEVENLESSLFARDIPSYFMDFWFELKKDLSRIENFYFRNEMVYKEFLKKSSFYTNEFNDEFKDIEDNIQFQSSNVLTLKARLESLYHYHDSIKGDRLNKTLLMLTVISGVFLPLNLIVGFFGMNTPGLFFSADQEGTQKVLLLLGAIVIICLGGIKIIRLIDHYLLRFVLGRYDFYKRLSNRLDEFDGRLKGK